MLFKRSAFIGFRLILFSVISIVLMCYDYNQHQLKRFRSIMLTAVAPLQYAVAWPVEMLGWVKTNVTTQRSLIEENARLQADSLHLKAQMQRILALQKENKNLRALLQSTSELVEHFTVAQILAVSTEPYVAQVVVNLGNKEQVYLGQPVLDAYGVMGQITQIGSMTSRIMLVTDVLSAVPVQVERNGMRGVVLGTGPDRNLTLVNIADFNRLKEGDILTTSGLGLRYPAGYPVGIISSIVYQPGEHFAKITVRPAARLDRTRQVLVLWPETKTLYKEAKSSLRKLSTQHDHRSNKVEKDVHKIR